MTAFFISLLAVLIVAALLGDSKVQNSAGLRRRDRSCGLIPVLSVGILVWTSALCVASPQANIPDPPEKPTPKASAAATGAFSSTASQDGAKDEKDAAKGSAIEVIIRTNQDSGSVTSKVKLPKVQVDTDAAQEDVADTDSPATEADPDSSDIFFVITKEGLNKLIAASGGNIEAFDVKTLKQASAFMPLSLSQSRALSPVLRTAASPMMLKGLFNPTNLKLIQELLENSYQQVETEATPIDHLAWDQFLIENSWIENPGIGQVVTMTGFVEEGRSKEIAKEVQAAIKVAVADRVQKLAEEKYGVSKLDTSTMDLSFFDPSQAIAQTAQWQELVYENGDTDSVMVRTHVLVDLPKKEIASLMAGVKKELQEARLVAVGITVALFWLGIALSSIAFRTFHTKSRFWKLVVIPMLSLAVIPCIVGACLMIGEMASGNMF